jgi:hypothetical protein
MFTTCTKLGSYRIRLKIRPADREDAWDLCQVALRYGGVEVDDGCFAFPDEEQWVSALEALRFRFGTEYFEARDLAQAETSETFVRRQRR